MGVDVGPGVLGLALLYQDVGHHLVDLGHQLEERVVGQVSESKLALTGVPGVRLPQHSMAVAWHNLFITITITHRDRATYKLQSVSHT